MRYSAYLAVESDIRPSRLVKIGDAPYDQTLPTQSQIVLLGRPGRRIRRPGRRHRDLAPRISTPSKTAGNAGNGNFQIWVAKVFA